MLFGLVRNRVRRNLVTGPKEVRSLHIESLEERRLLTVTVPEGPSNDTLAQATALPLDEDPSGHGLFTAFGTGSIDPAIQNNSWSDTDYWKFEALAGDRVSISMDTPASEVDPYFELRTAADVLIVGSHDDGPANDAFVSNYTIPSSGTYYIRSGKESASAVAGGYTVRVDLARGIDLESDANNANGTIAGANPLQYSRGSIGQSAAEVAGDLMASEGGDPDYDFFRLGSLAAGNIIDLRAQLPSSSTLDARVTVVDSSGTLLADTDGSPTDGRFIATVVNAGDYYAKVEANSGAGTTGQYLLDVNLSDLVAPTITAVSGLPANNSTTTDLTGGVVLTFSEQLDPSVVQSNDAWELRSAGDDGQFDTADDHLYGYTYASFYSAFDLSIQLFLQTGPALTPGQYRFSVSPALTDRAGNLLDGNGDGVAGDAFERVFTLSTSQFTPEGSNNDTQATATPLPFTEDPAGSGYFHSSVGLGSIDPLTSDLDYWSFTAQAGDVVSLFVDTPDSDLIPQLTLVNSSGSSLGTGAYAGPGSDAYVSSRTIPTTGTYYALVNKYSYSSSTPGNYQLRIDLARGIQLESDSSYSNNSISNANPLTLTTVGNHFQATVAGLVMGPENTTIDKDLFSLGLINPGETIELSTRLPAVGTLTPLVQVVDANGHVLADQDGNPLDGHFLAPITTAGIYYAQVRGLTSWSFNGHTYLLTSGNLTWSAAEAEAQAVGGHLVTINDQAEQDWLQTTFAQDPWIGLNDVATKGTWLWSSGQPVSYTNWSYGQPYQGTDYDYAYMASNDGQWRTSSTSGSPSPGIIELDTALPSSSGGEGPAARYLLDVDIADLVSPTVTGVGRLPANGEVTSELIGGFSASFSEALDVSFTSLNQTLYAYNGHWYLITPDYMSWTAAEAYAQSVGGHLATINDQAEQDWLQATFTQSAWIGINDEAAPGTYVWSSGQPVTYANWTNNQTNTYGYLNTNNGLWYTLSSSNNLLGLVELEGPDTDNDGFPDGFDPYPAEARNAFDLREAGADGLFDTADDVPYRLITSLPDSSNTNVTFTIQGGPLPSGNYRFLVNHALTDRAGNELDGNADGTGGDSYQQFFQVAPLPAGMVFEGSNNDTQATATPLPFTEDPAGSGYFHSSVGLGSIDPLTSDLDYWSFTAQAGDVVSLFVDTPDSDLIPQLTLVNSSGSSLGTGAYAGPGSDAYVSSRTIPTTGTYYALVNKYSYSSSTPGNYQLRIDLARGIQLESDSSYSNNSISNANPLTLTTVGDERSATIGGKIMSPGDNTVDADYYNLGTVNAGETILTRLRLPSYSTLRPVIEIRDSAGQLVSVNPNPTDESIARVAITTPGVYYAVVLALSGEGPDGQYLLDATIAPTSSLQFADLSVTAIISPSAVVAGSIIPLTWTVGNFGTSPTNVDAWTDRVVLSSNDIYGDSDDVQIGLASHSGTLGNLDGTNSYERTLSATLPLNLTGDYWLFVATDSSNRVFELDFENNNVTRSTNRLHIDPPQLPDLVVDNATATGAGMAGQLLSGSSVVVNWSDVNAGNASTNGAWTDHLTVLNTTTGQTLLSTDVPYDPLSDGSIAAGDSRNRQYSFVLPDGYPGAGDLQILVTTDWSNNLLEYNAGGTAEMNNAATINATSTLASYPDLTVSDISASGNRAPRAGHYCSLDARQSGHGASEWHMDGSVVSVQ